MHKDKNLNMPSYDDMFLDVLKVIAKCGGSAKNSEIDDGVINLRQFPDDIVDKMHNSITTELQYRLGWTRTYLHKAGLITHTARSVWALTVKGAEASKQTTIDTRALKKLGRKYNATARQEPEEIPEWRRELAEVLHAMNPYAFEVLAQLLLRECGFVDVCVTKKSGDCGIDGTGKLKLNGIFSFNVAFQCKRYSGQVGSGEIRDFRGSLDNNIEKGVLITTGSFSNEARKEAKAPGKKQIDLMDGNDFIDKLVEYKIGLSPREEYDIDRAYFDSLASVSKDLNPSNSTKR